MDKIVFNDAGGDSFVILRFSPGLFVLIDEITSKNFILFLF